MPLDCQFLRHPNGICEAHLLKHFHKWQISSKYMINLRAPSLINKNRSRKTKRDLGELLMEKKNLPNKNLASQEPNA